MDRKLFKVITIFTLILLTAPAFVAAQFSQDVFAPFVSRLNAEAQGDGILLTWRDSDDIGGEYIVLRYSGHITKENWQNAAQIAVVESGKESYIDYPPSSEEYYYAIIARDKNDEVYPIFIPFRNKITKPVAAEQVESEQKLAAHITNVSAERTDSSVELSFTASEPDREIIIYRSTTPITTSTALSKAIPLKTVASDTENYSDYPIPGISYYYAVLDAGLVTTGGFKLEPGKNITTDPVQIPISTTSRTALPTLEHMRAMPLPFLMVNTGVESGESFASKMLPISEKQQLMEKTTESINWILKKIPAQTEHTMDKEILPTEKTETNSGEQQNLQNIVNSSFKKGEWELVSKQIKQFFRVPHTNKVKARAHFYLAQSYYFQNDYKKAFLEFLMARDVYYQHVTPWLDILYNKLRES